MYHVLLDGHKIGETALESGDPAMGVAFGRVTFSFNESPFYFFKRYCELMDVEINCEDESELLIDTRCIASLTVKQQYGVVLPCDSGATISGMDSDGYIITLEGISHPFYAEEFPQHCAEYEARFE